jgi:hypothetical protein
LQGWLSKTRKDKRGIRFRIGLWSAAEEAESSNYKELKNLVDTVSEEAKAGQLQDCKLFMFTDNSMAESCFYQGSSKLHPLHALVLVLQTLEMTYGMTIHIIHVSGNQMIAHGTDGCSRGSLMEGVMTGEDMLTFVDLVLNAVERHPPILDWVRTWTDCPDLVTLTPEGWYEKGHGITGGVLDKHKVWIPMHIKKGGLFLWTPPPAMVDVAIEELLKAQHKRTDTFHVVMIPRLMTP